jgi:hypothetical protein
VLPLPFLNTINVRNGVSDWRWRREGSGMEGREGEGGEEAAAVKNEFEILTYLPETGERQRLQ